MENDLICFCFNYTAEDIRQDYQKNGRSVILEKIQEEKNSGTANVLLRIQKEGDTSAMFAGL